MHVLSRESRVLWKVVHIFVLINALLNDILSESLFQTKQLQSLRHNCTGLQVNSFLSATHPGDVIILICNNPLLIINNYLALAYLYIVFVLFSILMRWKLRCSLVRVCVIYCVTLTIIFYLAELSPTTPSNGVPVNRICWNWKKNISSYLQLLKLAIIEMDIWHYNVIVVIYRADSWLAPSQ